MHKLLAPESGLSYTRPFKHGFSGRLSFVVPSSHMQAKEAHHLLPRRQVLVEQTLCIQSPAYVNTSARSIVRS